MQNLLDIVFPLINFATEILCGLKAFLNRENMKHLSLLPAIALMLLSCSAENEEIIAQQVQALSPVYVTVPDTSDAVTMETVERVAANFGNKLVETKATGEKSIESVLTIRSEADVPQLYVVNYSNNAGFMVISATKDYEPVLAYSEQGAFDVTAAENSGLSVWLDEQKYNIDKASSFPDSLKLKFRSRWMEYTDAKKEMPQTRAYSDVINLVSSQYNQWIAEGYTVYFLSDYKNTDEFKSLPSEVQDKFLTLPLGYANPNYGGRDAVTFVLCKTTTTVEEVLPLTKTTWDQIGGYNECVPNREELGCATVAVGQIMRYHEYPAYYPWDDMPNTEPETVTSQFLVEVGRALGIDYEHGDSGANINEMLAVLKNFGYSQSRQVGHDASVVEDNLKNNLPVLMTGFDQAGHGWVCDGFRSTYTGPKQLLLMTLEDCPPEYEPTKFLNLYSYSLGHGVASSRYHMNWGWGGISNGYFFDDNLTTDLGDGTLVNYVNDRKDIVDIYPNN